MTTILEDISVLLKDLPCGAWVAISEEHNRVLSFGPDAQAVLNEAHAKGEKHPLIARVPEQQASMFL